jgi:DNA-binding XRE family transcriptional regulator
MLKLNPYVLGTFSNYQVFIIMKTIIDNEYHEKLKTISDLFLITRRDMNMTQQMLAEKAQISHKTLQRFEYSKNITLVVFLKLADALNLSLFEDE